MVIAPPDYWVEETGQKAVIFYEKGVETLVLSTSFRGDAKDFAWIVPTPSKPDVSKGTQEVFTNLQKYTQESSLRLENVGGTLGLGGSQTATDSVTVIEEKQVDYYDVAVLAATDKDALANWLKEKGYNFPESASYLLQEYINNNWYFVAMRVNPESLAFTNVNQQLRSGGATPVVLRFSTERIVYPLRISSALEGKVNPVVPAATSTGSTDVPTPTYVPSAFGQALSLTSGGAPVYVVGTNFPNRQGGIAAHIKLRDTTASYRSILSLHDSTGADRMQFRLGTDSQGTYMQFIQYPATGSSVAWRTDQRLQFVPEVYYHVAVIWSADKQPEFYLNGEAQKTVPAYGETSWFGEDPEEGSKVVIGGRGAASDPLHGDIDDVVVYNRQVYNGDIMNLHSNAASALTASQGLTGASFYAGFNNSTSAVDGNDKILVQLSAFDVAPVVVKRPTTTITPIRSQPITLYVISDERKDATGFSTRYANWFPKQTVRDLAFASDGAPMLPAESKKLFVTVLTRTISRTGTLEDVFFRTATSQETLGLSPGESGADVDWKFWAFVGGSAGISVILLVVLLWRTRSRQKP
jgi:hypothetical protein